MNKTLWEISLYLLLLLATYSNASSTTTALAKRKLSTMSHLWVYLHDDSWSKRRKILGPPDDPQWNFQYLSKEGSVLGFIPQKGGDFGVFVVTDRTMEGCWLPEHNLDEMEYQKNPSLAPGGKGCLGDFKTSFAGDAEENRKPTITAIFFYALVDSKEGEDYEVFPRAMTLIKEYLVGSLSGYGASSDKIHLLRNARDSHGTAAMLAMKQDPVDDHGSSRLSVYTSAFKPPNFPLGQAPAAIIDLKKARDYECIEVDMEVEDLGEKGFVEGMDVWFETATLIATEYRHVDRRLEEC